MAPETPGRDSYPELAATFESTILNDVVTASQYEVVPTKDDFELLRRPLLGKNGYGEELFQTFERDSDDFGYGLKTLTIKVFPETGMKNTPGRVALQSHESRQEESAIVFNNTLAGVEIQLLYHQTRGVLTFTLADRHEDIEGLAKPRAESYVAPTVRLMFKDPSEKAITGVVTIYSEGEVREYKFVPTSPAQLILLGIVHAILHSPKA